MGTERLLLHAIESQQIDSCASARFRLKSRHSANNDSRRQRATELSSSRPAGVISRRLTSRLSYLPSLARLGPMLDDAREAAYKDHLPVPNKRAPAQPTNDTPEQIEAKRAERREKRLAEIQELNQEIDPNAQDGMKGFTPREFVSLASKAGARRFKVLTYNTLAQSLVKRAMYPGSDFLKWHERGPAIMREVTHYLPDIACLQEVDRLKDHRPVLAKAGYELRWENGYPDKLHGLLIAWQANKFKQQGEKVVLLDDLAFSSEPDKADGQKGRRRTGLTRVTRNVGLCLALSFADDASRGVIVATHHLFWHAQYVHERARQTGLWLREIQRFRQSRPEWTKWPLIFAGDFNAQPFEPTYRYLVGQPLLPRHRELLQASRVVHFTVDNLNRDACSFPFGSSQPRGSPEEEEDEGLTYANAEGDEDRVLMWCRPPRASDDLLTEQEIAGLFADEETGKPLALQSAYGDHYGELRDSHGVECFDGRPPDEGVDPSLYDGTGKDEPRWTSISAIWRCTLDYIFSLRGHGKDGHQLQPTGLLLLHKTKDCEPGLPRAGVGPSDHMALMVEYAFDDAPRVS